MTSRANYYLLLITLGLAAVASSHGDETTMPQPPIAKRVPKNLTIHGDTRVDDYYWMRERENPEVIAYLDAENAYLDAATAHTKAFQEKLFEEIKGRIKQDDSSAPYRYKSFFYYTRFAEGKQYPFFCRKHGGLDAPEEIMLDANVLAEGHAFCQVSGVRTSEDQRFAVYGADFAGRRFFTLRVRDLATGTDLDDEIENVTGNVVWANDDKTLFYAKQDPETLRSFQIFRHTLGTPTTEDALVYEEKDETFSCGVSKTKSRQYILISSHQTLADEYRYLPSDQPATAPLLFAERMRGHEYDIDHYGDYFYIRTNKDAKNFRLMRTRPSVTAPGSWEEVAPHRDDTLLEAFELFKDYLVLSERREALAQLRVVPWNGSAGHEIDFGEAAYDAGLGMNPEGDTTTLRYVYTSLTTPNSEYDYDLKTRVRTLVKRDEVLGGYTPGNYVTERLWAPARDGARVPISIVYRKDFKKDGSGPLLMQGYGSYGFSSSPAFSSVRLSLLDRGFAFAIAHVRGGEELGRAWYEDGRQKNKKNTFTDFIDCADYLVREKYTAPDRLYATGGSAGGLLMGAIMNLRPELFHGILAGVPFVDVVTTMLDDSIPLTTSEYDEWGDPNREDFYKYILSYSPYDNVEPKAYPNLLVTTGLHDSQVQYWEPAKWVAKLRAMNTGKSTILLKMDMNSGHGGASGRFEQYRETALRYAFILDLAGKTD